MSTRCCCPEWACATTSRRPTEITSAWWRAAPATSSWCSTTPLRDFFAAIFFVAIGLAIDPADLLPALPVALLLAAVTGATKVMSGAYAAAREGAQASGRARAGAILVIRGDG